MIIKVYIMYNDGILRGQNLPIDPTRDETKQAIEAYDLLSRFKYMTYIRDFKVKLIKRNKYGERFEINVEDLIQHTNEQI